MFKPFFFNKITNTTKQKHTATGIAAIIGGAALSIYTFRLAENNEGLLSKTYETGNFPPIVMFVAGIIIFAVGIAVLIKRNI